MCVKLLTNNFLLEKAIGKSKDVHLAVLRVLPEVIRESVDADASSKSVIIYDPATGEKKMVSPTAVDGIESLGEVKTAEQREAEINAQMQDAIQRSKDWLEGNVANPVGMQIQLGDGRIATIEAMHEDGKSAIATLPDGTQFLVPKDVLQRVVNNGHYADYKARRDAEASKREAEQGSESAPETATEGGQPLPEEVAPKEEERREYAQGDEFDVIVDGQKMHAEIVSPKDADGRFVVNVDDGESMRTLYVTPEELAAMEYREEPSPKVEETRLATEDSSEKALERGAQLTEEHAPTALERIPRDEKGNAQFHDVDTETAWDGLVDMSGNEETAHKVAEASLANAEKKLKAAKALKEKGDTPEELLRSIKENEKAVAEAEKEVAAWKAIVGEKSRREEATKAEAERIATEKAEAERKAAEERERAEKEEEARVEAERKAEEERKTKEEERKERDENGQPFVVSSDGTTTFGEITEDTGLTAAPIKLSEGVADKKGNGYGLRHIEARHGDQIRKAGFSSVEEFVKYVASNYDKRNIKIGKKRANGVETYLIQAEDEHSNVLYVELSKDGSYWNVNSGGIFRKGYAEKKKDVGQNTEHPTSATTLQDKSFVQTDKDNGSQSADTHSDKQHPSADKGTTLPADQQTSDKENTKKVADSEGENTLKAKIEAASAEVNTEPTEAQKEAGNYKKGHVQVGTFDITIEQPEGSIRRGTDADGKQWESKMHNTYGYFRGTEGVDGDHIDVFLSNDIDGWNGRKVFVVDQYNPDGTFDEHKVMLGFNDMDEAKSDYLANYEKGWENGRRITVSTTNLEDFEKWIDSSHRKTKPFSEYSSVNKETVANGKPEKKQKKQSVFDKAKEIADKEEKKRKAEAEDDSALGQATRAVGKKKKVNLFKYTASKIISHPALRGVHYANGYAYASDGYILFKEKADYPKEWEGTTRDKDGNLIDGKYPDTEKAIHRLVHIPDKEVESLPSKEVLDFAIAASKKLKGEAIPVAIDGLFFNAVNLKKFLEAVASKGMDKVVYRHPMLYATNGKDEIIMMPIVNTLEGALDIADKMESAGLPKEQIDAWKAHIEAADKKMSFDDFKKAVENAKEEGVDRSERENRSEKTELTEEERELRDNLVERMRKGGLDVVTDSEEMQRVIDTENERTRNKRSKKSEAARKRDEALYAVDWSTAFVSGKSREEATEIRRERGRKFKEETKELYGRVLSGNFDDVTLRLIDEFIDKSTPNNPYERPISKRLPTRALQKMRGGERTGSVDALFSRICESAVGKDGKALPRAERERAIEEKKKELLKKWAIATGNWHTDVSDFSDGKEPIGSGTDSDVYLSKDGKSVIKVSKGKPYGKRFRPDVDNVALFNTVFPGSRYTIEGYGEIDGKFVRFLKQPFVDFSDSTPLTEGERVAYMEKLGFKPINKENTAFSNGEIVASDLQKSNVVRDRNGNVRVIDADMKLHTKDVGGNYSYPDVEADTRTDQRFLRTAGGEVYGLVKDGRIYLDPKVATSETAVHEYTHLWGDMLRRKDPEQWSRTVKELKNSVLWEEVKELYPELKTDDEIADEVLSTFSGRRGAERLREEARKVADGDGGVFTKAKAIETLERVKEAIARFWESVARMFGINRYRSAEELADMAMRDLLDSKNPMKDESGMRKRGEVGETLATSGTYFSGGGLLEAGLKGVIDPKVAVEFSEKIAGVYADNHGNHIVVADVRDVDPKKLVGAVDGGEVQYFHASPVCKNFSKAKREGGEVELDKETALSTAEFIAKTRPKVVTIENVKGYRNSEALKIITDELTRQGYDWDADVYNAADYGGYTKRERLIVRAKRDGKLPPKPEKLPEELRKKGWYSAVEDLIPHLEEKKTGVPQGTDERLKNSGIDYRTIDKPLYVFGRGYANKTIGHAFADELLPTLTTGGGDIIIMPDGRVLKASPRVLARVTGLPDTYKMPETDQLSHTIVGNGIPTQLTEGVIAPLLDNAIPSAERATKRESVFDVADRVSQNLEERTRAMGSRVEKRMADVAQKLEGRELTAEQKAVVDVFSGEKDNQKFSVERNGVKQQFLLKQGQEDKAGAKHSLYRHYGTNTGVITADDVLKIPQVLERGERIEKAKGGKKMAVYTMDIDGVKYTVLTRVGKNNEIVDDFYSNKKGSESSVYRNVENIDNTPEGARRKDSEPSAKVEDKSESPKLFGEEIIDDGKKGSDSTDRSVRENPKNEDKPRFSRKPGESIFDYASRVSEDVDRSVRERVSARDEYEKKVKSKGFQTKEALQNSMLGLQEFMSAIDHASGNKRYIEDIPDFENPILGENRLSSVNKEEMHQVAKTQFKPLMSAVAKLSGNGKESGELYDYMFAKHGLERDAVMRQREAKKEFDKYKKANPKGTKTIGDFVASLEGKDYAGLTALTAEDGRVKSIQSQVDAIDEQMEVTDNQLLLHYLGGQKKRLKVDLLNAARDAADDIRKTFENNPSHDRSDINELWSRVNEVNGNTLRKLYESGMLTKEAYNDISSMYTNYIPMRGFDQTTSADAYAYLTHGDSAFNAPIKTAKGRSSKADNPIAYMQAMAESAIMQGNRNVLVKQKMLNFVRNHPSDLASVSDVWLQYDSVADEWKPVYAFGRESKG